MNQDKSSHGGARKGAGRKAGSATAKTREIADAAAEQGITPLEFMLNIMRYEGSEIGLRFEAAKAAAPYIHPRLAAIEHTGADGGPVQFTKVERVIVDPQN